MESVSLDLSENGYLRTDEIHENADRYYQFCTAFPVGTALAQTWDTALVEKVGIAVAEEMEEFHIDLWLAPGLNIQRNLCAAEILSIIPKIRCFPEPWQQP